MKLKFKQQDYQTAAVQAVVDCFKGQPPASPEAVSYRVDPGKRARGQTIGSTLGDAGFRNAELLLGEKELLANIQQIQRENNLPISDRLVKTKVADVNLDVEMETGTGKTYCYLKTIFELNRQYGWSKFIIVVPSIAIREGVARTLAITAEHFHEAYQKKARAFIYNSRHPHELESFSSDAGINVMVINVQAFNATGKDNRRIYDELDDFQSRRPIDVISANRPILILDEPQKMEGGKTLDSLAHFRPLMLLRYSATHKTTHNKVHRLDALDAYNQKLVKKIAVRGITTRGLAGTAAYLYLQSIEVSANKPPQARVEFEQKRRDGTIKRVVRKLEKGDNLFALSNELEQYREGFVVSDINAVEDTLSFTNDVELTVGDAIGDVNEAALRRIQIRETIKAHFDKEEALFQQGVKVLSLFFIDEVVKYRDYDSADEKGDYARIFEEEYTNYLNEVLELVDTPWTKYLKSIDVDRTHAGYFSIDKKTRRLSDPDEDKRGENAGLSNDADAYDLILKDKERLLSLAEPVRFIFSHSALREGWDNPNVFVICALKHSDNTISRRQEVGRGLRLSVDQHGDRMDSPATVHDINVLTVVASESYKSFVAALQADISASLSTRPRKADEAYFTGKVLKTDHGDVVMTPAMAKQLYRYLAKNDYTDDFDAITQAYHQARKAGTLSDLPAELKPYEAQVIALIDSVHADARQIDIDNGRTSKRNPLNANFETQEFKALWNRINRKAAYHVDFDTSELVRRATQALNHKDDGLTVTPLRHVIETGQQQDHVTYDQLAGGEGFRMVESTTESHRASVHSAVRYDLIGKVAEGTHLTRRTVAEILKGMIAPVFAQYRMNPESFIAGAIRLINEQKAALVVEHLSYDPVDERFDLDIFTAGQTTRGVGNAGDKLQKHIYDYVPADSKVERDFARQLDASSEVAVYAKLPRGFVIPTPVGNYNPDWAIGFKEGKVKHVYFVAETKGSTSSEDRRGIEQKKIECAREFFEAMNRHYAPDDVRYDVVDSFETLMDRANAASSN